MAFQGATMVEPLLSFPVRLKCPPGTSDCESQKSPSSDDGCGQELTNWYEKLKRAAIAGAMQSPVAASKPRSSLTMAKLPQECSTVLAAGGFEPQPVNASSLPPQVLKALASKESDPRHLSLTPQPVQL